MNEAQQTSKEGPQPRTIFCFALKILCMNYVTDVSVG